MTKLALSKGSSRLCFFEYGLCIICVFICNENNQQNFDHSLLPEQDPRWFSDFWLVHFNEIYYLVFGLFINVDFEIPVINLQQLNFKTDYFDA